MSSNIEKVAIAINLFGGLVQNGHTSRDEVPDRFPECDVFVPFATDDVYAASGRVAGIKLKYASKSTGWQWTVLLDGDREVLGTVFLVNNKTTSGMKLTDTAGRLMLLDALEKSVRTGGDSCTLEIGGESTVHIAGKVPGTQATLPVKEIVLKRASKRGSEQFWRYMCGAQKCGRVFEEGSLCTKHYEEIVEEPEVEGGDK
ncbi:hypothetical protein MIND_00911500 [Mycena indigotica]|uniref:Uncharacterized protein n=1 Tax=Mycena indigotica TaxID=2126181 RepID=A0A8H6SDL2_9AGAR|nr:uncharacterized protein MIND_00911500 [Mycena indigotica]KAF7296805.1 hypothetical protein MIND_00911500 [Mycena indigotica]